MIGLIEKIVDKLDGMEICIALVVVGLTIWLTTCSITYVFDNDEAEVAAEQTKQTLIKEGLAKGLSPADLECIWSGAFRCEGNIR